MLDSAIQRAIRASPADHDFLGFSSPVGAWRRSSAASSIQEAFRERGDRGLGDLGVVGEAEVFQALERGEAGV